MRIGKVDGLGVKKWLRLIGITTGRRGDRPSSDAFTPEGEKENRIA